VIFFVEKEFAYGVTIISADVTYAVVVIVFTRGTKTAYLTAVFFITGSTKGMAAGAGTEAANITASRGMFCAAIKYYPTVRALLPVIVLIEIILCVSMGAFLGTIPAIRIGTHAFAIERVVLPIITIAAITLKMMLSVIIFHDGDKMVAVIFVDGAPLDEATDNTFVVYHTMRLSHKISANSTVLGMILRVISVLRTPCMSVCTGISFGGGCGQGHDAEGHDQDQQDR